VSLDNGGAQVDIHYDSEGVPVRVAVAGGGAGDDTAERAPAAAAKRSPAKVAVR
jgi:hypothetical protein